jgi:short-subunit dehydrogenase
MARTALITGASAGLGKAFAEKYAKEGFDLVLVARREDRLNSLATQLQSQYSIRAHVVVMDLANPDAARDIFEKTEALGLEVDTLINNAGYGITGQFGSHSDETYQNFLQVMVASVVALSKAYVGGMKARGFGRIINVSSVAAFLPGTAENNLYNGSKALLNCFSESLNKELSHQGVFVTAICPGFTRTEFHDHEGFQDLIKTTPKFMWSKAEEVVQTAFNASNIEHKVIVIHGLFYKFFVFLAWLLPNSIVRKIVG